ncbi:MAG: hypothetical protein J2P55_01145 [Rhizobiales bacterium]|nr:hypothetical protein [Hyphomicrobiales bacterium]
MTDEPHGALFFWKDEPYITGFLKIGHTSYELVGVKKSEVRTDLRARKIEPDVQRDMFDDNGSRSGERKRDLSGG